MIQSRVAKSSTSGEVSAPSKPASKAPSLPPNLRSALSASPSTAGSREFDAFRPYSDEVLARVWSSGLIVLDANVLLHLYRVDSKLRDALFKILENKNIASRLFVPHQVATEFFSNRVSVIAGQLRTLETMKKRVSETLQALPDTKDTPRFLIDREKLKTTLKEFEAKILEFLSEAQASYPASVSQDEILDRLSPILSAHTGAGPDSGKRRSLVEEGTRRVKEKVPPGFHDGAKPENGDYLVWAQCLERCAAENRDLLLITDDNKEDWWHRVSAYTVGPRPELRREFYQAVPDADFVLATFETFIERIAKYVFPTLPAELVDDARQFALSRPRTLGMEELDWDVEQEHAVKHYRDTAPTKDDDAVKSVDAMVSWFHERYDDPANGVPYDGREGGYQYVGGGPYSAEDELREKFDDGRPRTERLIKAAVSRIENEGSEWVKKGEY